MTELLVNIDVPDLDKGISFYGGALGLQVGRRLGAKAVEMLGASAAIYLLECEPGTRPFKSAESERRYDRHWTPVHFDLVVTHIDAAVQRAAAGGATLEGQVEDRAWGRLARMSDPFGHGFCFVEFRGKGYDEISTNRPTGDRNEHR